MIAKPILLTVCATLIGLISGSLGWSWQVLIVYFTYLVAALFLLQRIKGLKTKYQWCGLLLLPWLASYGAVVFMDELYHVFFVFLSPIIGVLTAVTIVRFRKTKIKIKFEIASVILIASLMFVVNELQIENKLITYYEELPDEELTNFALSSLSPIKDGVTLYHLWSMNCSACFKEFAYWEQIELCSKESQSWEVRHLHLASQETEKSNIVATLSKLGIDSLIVESSTYLDEQSSELIFKAFKVQGVPSYILTKNANLLSTGNTSFAAFSHRNLSVIVRNKLGDSVEIDTDCLKKATNSII